MSKSVLIVDTPESCWKCSLRNANECIVAEKTITRREYNKRQKWCPFQKVSKGMEECEPEYLGENTAIGCRDGRCKCGNLVRSYQNFCDECGIQLNWGNVHRQQD